MCSLTETCKPAHIARKKQDRTALASHILTSVKMSITVDVLINICDVIVVRVGICRKSSNFSREFTQLCVVCVVRRECCCVVVEVEP